MTKDIAEIQKVIDMLSETFPMAFTKFNRRPPKEGIHKDLEELFSEEELDRRALSRALRFYTRNGGYLAKLVAGAPRIDLFGEEVPGQFVTPEQESYAQAIIAEKSRRWRAKKAEAAKAKKSKAKKPVTAEAKPLPQPTYTPTDINASQPTLRLNLTRVA